MNSLIDSVSTFTHNVIDALSSPTPVQPAPAVVFNIDDVESAERLRRGVESEFQKDFMLAAQLSALIKNAPYPYFKTRSTGYKRVTRSVEESERKRRMTSRGEASLRKRNAFRTARLIHSLGWPFAYQGAEYLFVDATTLLEEQERRRRLASPFEMRIAISNAALVSSLLRLEFKSYTFRTIDSKAYTFQLEENERMRRLRDVEGVKRASWNAFVVSSLIRQLGWPFYVQERVTLVLAESVLSRALAGASELAHAAGPAAKNAALAAESAAESALSYGLDRAQAAMPMAKQAAFKAESAAETALIYGIGAAMSAGLAVKNAAVAAAPIIKDAALSAKNAAYGAVEAAKQPALEAAAVAKQAASDAVDVAADAAITAAPLIKNAAYAAADVAVDAASNVALVASDLAHDASDLAKAAASSAADAAVDAVYDAADLAHSAALSAGEAANAVQKTAQGVVTVTSDKLDSLKDSFTVPSVIIEVDIEPTVSELEEDERMRRLGNPVEQLDSLAHAQLISRLVFPNLGELEETERAWRLKHAAEIKLHSKREASLIEGLWLSRSSANYLFEQERRNRILDLDQEMVSILNAKRVSNIIKESAAEIAMFGEEAERCLRMNSSLEQTAIDNAHQVSELVKTAVLEAQEQPLEFSVSTAPQPELVVLETFPLPQYATVVPLAQQLPLSQPEILVVEEISLPEQNVEVCVVEEFPLAQPVLPSAPVMEAQPVQPAVYTQTTYVEPSVLSYTTLPAPIVSESPVISTTMNSLPVMIKPTTAAFVQTPMSTTTTTVTSVSSSNVYAAPMSNSNANNLATTGMGLSGRNLSQKELQMLQKQAQKHEKQAQREQKKTQKELSKAEKLHAKGKDARAQKHEGNAEIHAVAQKQQQEWAQRLASEAQSGHPAM